jgi:RHH-type transcriptional regulator, proline utilization regulon repressor / proline dehydrogenase / delta 1-pyrroline-5-carboxylate dehydrogenase
VRVVKGANLLMERVDAALHGWPVTVWPTKEDTDAHYKRVIEWAMTPERVKNVQLGIAGHNLFDLAFAHHLATQRGVDQGVEAEMLLGMAPEQADAVRETLGPLVLYTPVVDHSEFDSAVAYLIRRLEENASADNFMSAVFDLHDVSVFEREEQRFRRSLARLDEDIPPRRRSQDRGAEAMIPSVPGAFANEPDTDPSLPATQEWLARIRKATGSKRSQSLGLKTLQQGLIADSLGPIGGQIAVDDLVAKMRAGAGAWAKMSARARAEVLYRAADELGRARADLLTVMMEETGKTLAEGDPEVSEAIDFARYYAHQAIDWAGEPGVAFRPVKLTVVAPPWNFPVAIPTGSVTAALAAGSAVIIKPAPQARRCAAVMVEVLWAAGVPRDVLWLADVAEGDLGRSLLTHPGVDRVVLTGSFETAKLFRHWRADLPLIAETSGKNAIIITPSADIDLAVADVVKSAFGHAGQKCSAASLAIVVGSVADSARFRRKLLDAVTTLSVGYPDQPSAVVGPVIEPPGPKLRSGLTELADGETWLLEPRALDDSGRLWSPGIRDGVKPGSVFHQTEYFGPILGLVRASNLDEAIRIQNGVDYGLTAGIHSLSSAEVATWIERVEAGNLYVNRGITGAIVQRQPFGGWKKSSVGPTAKAGGPNYLSAFGRFEPIETELAPDLPEGIDSSVAGIIQAASEGATGQERAFLLRSVLSDAQAWSKHFGASPDVSGVAVEANVFRYRPAMATVRVSALTPIVEVARVLLAARSVGAQVSLSLAEKLPDPVLVALSRPGSRFGGISELHVESELAFVARVATNPPRRIRLLRGSPAALQVHFDGNPQVAIWADPVTESGRVEGLPFVHEQAVSITLHRFGALDPRMDAVAKSL